MAATPRVRDPRELALRIRLRAVRMVAPQGFGTWARRCRPPSRWPPCSPLRPGARRAGRCRPQRRVLPRL